jgi:alpha-galactosidase
VGKVKVVLPGPARSFEAVAGVDSRDSGYYSNFGRGAVVASVEVNGKEPFRSAVMREGMPGVPVKVDLDNAREFILKVEDGGGGNVFGNDFNQADWAEARVVLADGRTVWLGDLPTGPLRAPYSAEVPFSFRYGDRPSSVLLKTWELERSSRRVDENKIEHTLTYTDPATGLVLRCVAVEYQDYPVVEWTLYFKNTGSGRTRTIENIQALDTRFEREAGGEFVLHHNKGTEATPTDYEPFETPLVRKAVKQFSAENGRPTSSDLCYFNVEWPGEGVIIALGWPGQWAAQFARDEGNGLDVRAGQELTHFKLLPGEEVRGPLVAMLFWKGGWIGAQNTWRRWMIAHNLPRPGGKLPPPQIATGTNGYTIEMQGADEANQKQFMQAYLDKGLKFDYWWMDAGWYPFKDGWWNTGTWEPDARRFPHGLRPVSDAAHAKGMKVILWFEPERVTAGSWLWETHPDWLLGPDKGDKLLYLGNPDALKWLIDHTDRLITEQGIDLYRQDFNFETLAIWRANDDKDRQGITEIRHVTGYLAFWDELRRRHPEMLIDTCASGGRRNDLETLRRAVPLWRSDYALDDPTGMQNLTYGAALWIPFFGTGTRSTVPYSFRSTMVPALSAAPDPRSTDVDFGMLRRLTAEWREISSYYYGDYYPLMPYSTDDSTWVAWQFDCPEKGEGMVQAFRRPQSPLEKGRFKLRGLDLKANYAVRNLDVPGEVRFSGQELSEKGLPVTIGDQPGAAVIIYRQVKGSR